MYWIAPAADGQPLHLPQYWALTITAPWQIFLS